MNKEDPNHFYRCLSLWIDNTGGLTNFATWSDLTNPANVHQRKLKINQALLTKFSNDSMLKGLLKEDYELFEKYDRFTN